jgi:hypothetical protein
MAPKRHDLIGRRFGRLVVEEYVGKASNGQSLWICNCDCGAITTVRGGNLSGGQTKSCGCLARDILSTRRTTHGHSKSGKVSKEMNCWMSMIKRCERLYDAGYVDYGGRGIKVCERWHKFENFFEDMGPCPPGMTLERIDNNGDYCKENCKWATRVEQQNNRRSIKWVEYKGETKNLTQWSKALGINISTIRQRLYTYGWSVEKTFNTPTDRVRIVERDGNGRFIKVKYV